MTTLDRRVPKSTTESKSFETDIPISIEEFRKPEMEMKGSSSQGNSLLLGDKTTLTATTHYFSGGGVPNAQVSWDVTASPTSYTQGRDVFARDNGPDLHRPRRY
ncbi:MAG: hypothetical protein K2X93_03540 [Candidatus Obscuribacterales bacterium]|nr:hypothetical protein [Candidatus Obscuribacterales bacterium]